MKHDVCAQRRQPAACVPVIQHTERTLDGLRARSQQCRRAGRRAAYSDAARNEIGAVVQRARGDAQRWTRERARGGSAQPRHHHPTRGAVAPVQSRGVLRPGSLVDPAHTLQACNGLDQNSQAGGPETRGDDCRVALRVEGRVGPRAPAAPSIRRHGPLALPHGGGVSASLASGVAAGRSRTEQAGG